MALNKTIVLKVRDMTASDTAVGDFLVKLLEYESESHGWYKSDYSAFLEKACKEEKQDANP